MTDCPRSRAANAAKAAKVAKVATTANGANVTRRAHAARAARVAALALLLAAPGGCYVVRPSHGGGETEFSGVRRFEPLDVAVPAGYEVELVASGFTFPTGVTFDTEGRPCVVESGYAYGESFTTPRLLRVRDGVVEEIARGEGSGPWTGVVFHDGRFLVADGGTKEGGRILSITPDGRITALASGLPSMGDHHVNGPAVGPDGRIYFGIGTATNSGVVGTDNAAFGWLARHPQFHDIPGADVRLSGAAFTTEDPRDPDGEDVVTGAYSAFGSEAPQEQLVRGAVPCTGAVLALAPEAPHAMELVAWGLRNPFGLAFTEDGRLLVTDNGYDERGSRPVWGSPDMLWAIDDPGPRADASRPAPWYGWPDFVAGRPIDVDEYAPPGGDIPQRLFAEAPGTPPAPLALFPCHASANGLDVSGNAAFGHAGQAFVALFGDQVPATGKLLSPVGFKVVRVALDSGVTEDFAVNRGPITGPASLLGNGGLERPVAVRFDPAGEALYVVDFGVLLQRGERAEAQSRTGALWRIRRIEVPGTDPVPVALAEERR